MTDIRINMGKTITTYLIDGKPHGARYSKIDICTCKMYIIPRADIDIVRTRKELSQSALYILLLGDNEQGMPTAYIGECANFAKRIKGHNKKSWEHVLVFIADNNIINKADVKYLEYLAINACNQANEYILPENKQIPSIKDLELPEPQENTNNLFFDAIKTLTFFSGYNIFNEIDNKNHHELFFTKARGVNAKGFYNERGFTVQKGSILAKDMTDSFSPALRAKREMLIAKLTSNVKGDIVLNSDYTFPSPSAASHFCLGRFSNGWLDWKDKTDQTLNDVYRKKLE